MQSRRFPLRGAALVAVLALLLATPALAAPMGTMGTGDASWLGFEAIWHRLAGAFGVPVGANGLTATGPASPSDAPSSIDRVTGANGQHIDPNGSPESTGSSYAGPGDRGAVVPGGAEPNG